MCAAAPEVAPFMADEAVLSVPNLGKLDYTQKHYMAFASKIQEKAREVSTLGMYVNACVAQKRVWLYSTFLFHFFSDGYRRWSAHDVELALWSFHFAKKLQPELLDDEGSGSEPTEPRGKKRTNHDENSTDSEGEEQDSSSQATKKRKQ